MMAGRKKPERIRVRAAVRQAVHRLEAAPVFCRLMPEVRVNVVYAAAGAASSMDVAAVDGRITVVGGRPKAAGPVRFGVSDHMARLVLELNRHDPVIRAGMNFRWHESVLAVVKRFCRDEGLELGWIDRSQEPEELVGRDQASIPWKVKVLLDSTSGVVPPVFYESRGWGKEPLFFLVGPEPVGLVRRVLAIARRLAAAEGGPTTRTAKRPRRTVSSTQRNG